MLCRVKQVEQGEWALEWPEGKKNETAIICISMQSQGQNTNLWGRLYLFTLSTCHWSHWRLSHDSQPNHAQRTVFEITNSHHQESAVPIGVHCTSGWTFSCREGEKRKDQLFQGFSIWLVSPDEPCSKERSFMLLKNGHRRDMCYRSLAIWVCDQREG